MKQDFYSPVELDTVATAIDSIRQGKAVVVVDNEDRENEGDLIFAASHATPELVAFMVRYSSGYICAALEGEALDHLALPPMTAINEDAHHTAYAVTVDVANGSTGISATNRAATLRALADPESMPEQFTRPGHVVPLRARPGGVLERQGHTEAAVDLARLAGLPAVGVLCEIVSEIDPSDMARAPELREFSRRHGLPMISIDQLVAWRRTHEVAHADAPGARAGSAGVPEHGAGDSHTPVPSDVQRSGSATTEATPASVDASASSTLERVTSTRLPTQFGEFTAYGYRTAEGTEHVALVVGDVRGASSVLVRVHSECLTGDVFGSRRCDCGEQLHASMRAIQQEGRGVVCYLRGHEGRGIGLMAKLQAYRLQDDGADTVDANLALGLPDDARDYHAVPLILRDLGIRSIRLMSNNPAKVESLEADGVSIAERVAVVAHVHEENRRYLTTKRDRMGHDLPWLDEPAAHTSAS